MRAVFGTPESSERVRLLAELVERSISYFALALAAELQAGRHTNPGAVAKLQASLARNLDRPHFQDWVSVVDAFRRRGTTHLCSALRECLDAPYPSQELRALQILVAPERQTAQEEVAASRPTRRHALDVVREVRNRLAAHGTPDEDGVAYASLLPVAVRLLASLPWEAAVLHISADAGGATPFQGCLPDAWQVKATGATDERELFLALATDGGEAHRVPAAPFFSVGPNSAVTLHAGTGRRLDPMSGIQLEVAHG
jgi:hypothetical protein